MLNLSPPLWLFSTRAGDTPVPEAERHRLSVGALERIVGARSRSAVQSIPALVLSSRLSAQVLADGHLPVGFEDILRSVLDEIGLKAPLRLMVESADGDAKAQSFTLDGIGASLANLEALEAELGSVRASAHVRRVTRELGQQVFGIARNDLDAIAAALHEKYRPTEGASDEKEMRAATRLMVRFVEARANRVLPDDAAGQVALLLPALATVIPSAVVVLEPVREAFAIEGRAFRRHPATGEPTIVIEARVFGDSVTGSAPASRVDSFAQLEQRAQEAGTQLEAALDAIESHSATLAGARFLIDGSGLRECVAITTEVSPIARLRTAVALERAGRLSRERALASVADLEDLGFKFHAIVDDEVIEPLARGAIAAMGVRSGRIALSAEQAARYRRAGHDVVIVFDARTKPALLDLALGRAVILVGGGIDSDLARATRRIGVPSLVFADAAIDEGRAELVLGEEYLREGDPVTVDGWTGALYAGELPIVDIVRFPESEVVAVWRRTTVMGEQVFSGTGTVLE